MTQRMVTIGNLELPEDQARDAIARLSPRTKNNIIRRKIGLPPGESDDDIVEIGGISITRAQSEKIIADMPPERLNKIIKSRMGRE